MWSLESFFPLTPPQLIAPLSPLVCACGELSLDDNTPAVRLSPTQMPYFLLSSLFFCLRRRRDAQSLVEIAYSPHLGPTAGHVLLSSRDQVLTIFLCSVASIVNSLPPFSLRHFPQNAPEVAPNPLVAHLFVPFPSLFPNRTI